MRKNRIALAWLAATPLLLAGLLLLLAGTRPTKEQVRSAPSVVDIDNSVPATVTSEVFEELRDANPIDFDAPFEPGLVDEAADDLLSPANNRPPAGPEMERDLFGAPAATCAYSAGGVSALRRCRGTLACLYSCSASHVVQRVCLTSPPIIATTAWFVSRRSRGQ